MGWSRPSIKNPIKSQWRKISANIFCWLSQQSRTRSLCSHPVCILLQRLFVFSTLVLVRLSFSLNLTKRVFPENTHSRKHALTPLSLAKQICQLLIERLWRASTTAAAAAEASIQFANSHAAVTFAVTTNAASGGRFSKG